MSAIRGCSKCHQPGHYAKTCGVVSAWNAARQRHELRATGVVLPRSTCSKCGQAGHNALTCGRPRKQRASSERGRGAAGPAGLPSPGDPSVPPVPISYLRERPRPAKPREPEPVVIERALTLPGDYTCSACGHGCEVVVVKVVRHQQRDRDQGHAPQVVVRERPLTRVELVMNS